jgi:YbgC/YbaW family acyl-CoA thioester hydrolase
MWYLGWCDEAMSAFMDSIGFGYATLRAQGFDAVLRKAEIEWLDSLQAFQHAEVAVRVDQIGKTSFRLHYDIERVDIERVDIERVDISPVDISPVDTQRAAQGRTRCARAAITYVCVEIDGRGKVSIPSRLREALETGHR